MKTVVSEKGQITIPKPLRVRLGIRKGQVLDVREERGRLVMTKRASRDPFDKYFGILKLGRRTDEIIKELRGGEYPPSGSDYRRRQQRAA
jgi:antitoxin PrlF